MNRTRIRYLACAVVAIATLVSGSRAQAERKPPFGADAALLEARVREDMERRIVPLLEQMAPGQAELKYVDVRVNRPSALPTGAAPGFEDLSPGAEFIAEKAEVSITLDSKLPAPFRKDLKNLVKNRLEGLGVPIEIKETLIPFPTPRPQPQEQQHPQPMYYPMPQPSPQPQPQPQPVAAPAPMAPPPVPVERGIPWWMVLVMCLATMLLGLLIALTVVSILERRARRRAETAAAAEAERKRAEATATAEKKKADTAAEMVDHLPEVRRALREDRVIARRVIGELLRQNELEKVARTVELVGPTVVDDLRGDPGYGVLLRDAAALLDRARPATETEARELADELHRRILKHRMMGAEDPVEQEFAFVMGLPPARFAAILATETPAVQAVALRFAPTHLRSSYLAGRSGSERASLAAALASPRPLGRDHMLDIAATLRARAIEQAHVGSGETDDVDLAVEMIEDRPRNEQIEILEAMRRSDPARARQVEGALICDETFMLVGEDVLSAAVMSVPSEVLGRYLRFAPAELGTRVLGVLPPTVAAGLHEELSLDVTVPPAQLAEARRTMYLALRRKLRERGLPAPIAERAHDKGKVVNL